MTGVQTCALPISTLYGNSELTADVVRIAYGDVLLAADTDLLSDSVLVKIADTALLTAQTTFTGTGLPIYRFVDPHYEQVYTSVLPMSRYGIDTGQTIIFKDGVTTITDYPYQQTLEEADWYILGGRNYQLTQSQYNDLVNSGYGYLVEVA